MRIKRSHFESLQFVIGTLLTCFLVISVSSNLQAHPLVKMLDQKPALETTPLAPFSSGCEVRSEEKKLPVEPEIASLLEPYSPPVTESLDQMLEDACAAERASAPIVDDVESLNALLETIETALHPTPEQKTCEDLLPVTQLIASN